MAGGYGAGDPPDPIPNSEVKTRCADGTAGATRWESTAPPAFLPATPVPIYQDRGGRCSISGRTVDLPTAARPGVDGRSPEVYPIWLSPKRRRVASGVEKQKDSPLDEKG